MNKVLQNDKSFSTSKKISDSETITAFFQIKDLGQGPYFSITGEIKDSKIRGCDKTAACGATHDDIKEHFPELAHLIKYHLFSAKGPMHYVANSLYHASDKDCWGRRKGEPSSFDTVVYFDKVPFPMRFPDSIIKLLDGFPMAIPESHVEVVAHPREPDTYRPKYKLSCQTDIKEWYQCPFDDWTTANALMEAVKTCTYRIEKIATAYSEGKEPDLEAARYSAAWPEANLEDFTEEKLLARLPALMEAFLRDLAAVGLIFPE